MRLRSDLGSMLVGISSTTLIDGMGLYWEYTCEPISPMIYYIGASFGIAMSFLCYQSMNGNEDVKE